MEVSASGSTQKSSENGGAGFEAGTVGWGHAVRMGEWKAVSFFEGSPLQLYNLTADVGEENDISSKYPDVVAKMVAIAK